jgi:hypothetical protein
MHRGLRLSARTHQSQLSAASRDLLGQPQHGFESSGVHTFKRAKVKYQARTGTEMLGAGSTQCINGVGDEFSRQPKHGSAAMVFPFNLHAAAS